MNLLNNQKVRFVVIGIINSIFSIGVFVVIDFILNEYLVNRFVAYMSATIIATPISMIQAFFSQKYITFISDKSGRAMVDEFFRFVIVSGWVITVRILSMPIFVEIFDFHPWTSAVLINIIKAFVAYVGHSKYTFIK